MDKPGAVLVIGAGVGGIRASLDMAEAGFKVYLCDRNPGTGGTLIQLDKWFPDNHCGMCQMLPTFSRDISSQFCLRRGLIHPNIELLPLTEIKEVAGEAGDFQVTLISRAAGVSPELCTGCGLCAEICPVEAGSEFNQGLKSRKAIFTPNPYSSPQMYTIDWDICTRCGVCAEKCPTRAIQLNETEKIKQLRVGAIILSTGFEEFDPRLATQYGYRRYPNVVTSIELERMLSPGGPSEGELLRPSDGRPPGSVAFLQCIGSRDSRRNYCSSACCMFALKESMLIKQVNPQIDTHIFFMDMRAFGKDYYRYYEQARDKLGVQFSRCRVPVIKEDPLTRELILNAVADDGTQVKSQFDLVVLSVGQTPSPQFRELCQVLEVEHNRWGFCRTRRFSPVETTRDGIYVCGCASVPKDIADTLTEASAAASQVSKLLRNRQAKQILSPKPRELSEEEPRLGVLLCGCGEEISPVIDLEQVANFSRQIPGVVYIEQVPYLCHTEALNKISKAVSDNKINRLVIGACTSYAQKFTREIGFSASLIQVVNLREHVARVHSRNPTGATEKAKRLLTMAVETLKSQEFLPLTAETSNLDTLVIGGGLAGLTAALSIAQQGIKVNLAERTSEFGGNLKHVYSTLEGGDTQTLLESLTNQVKNNPLINLALEAEVTEVRGYAGNFEVILENRDSLSHSLEVGAIVVASGGEEYQPTEYLYGQNKQVVTQSELERKLFTGGLDPKNLGSVVMIQCVGSRDRERPYCSRICCSQALKNALKLKMGNPEVRLTILHRDIMAYGFKEEYYTLAREKGIDFVRYEPDNKPEVKQAGEKLAVEVTEPVLGGKLILEPDLVVLSPAIIPADNSGLADILGVNLNEDGFFQEAEVKFRPVEFLKEGIFVCGLAHSPRGVEESITQAQAVAQRVASLLASERLTSSPVISEINQRQCRKCELCISVCPYGARIRDEETDEIVVREILCQGCGACVVACPGGASKLRGFKDKQVFSLIDAAL